MVGSSGADRQVRGQSVEYAAGAAWISMLMHTDVKPCPTARRPRAYHPRADIKHGGEAWVEAAPARPHQNTVRSANAFAPHEPDGL